MSEVPDRHDALLPVAALKRIDRVCAAFEAAWKSGQRPPAERFFDDTPEPERSSLLRELLLLELDYRCREGEHPSREEYLARFPSDNSLIDTVFRFSSTAAAPPGGVKLRRFGDYELLERIAQGGMGIVYKARQVSLNRIVALKMILAGQLAAEEDVARFRREAQAAAHLQHPNIVAIHEVGEHDGQPFFSMDFVPGRSLREIVREGPLPARRAAQYVKAIAEATHYAHQHGTLHRDLKPANVLIDDADQVRITDFGLAKQVHEDPGLTGSGEIVGTPSYMPPEQALGRRAEVGPASDVYSLGAVLYELVTGQPPFRGETVGDVLSQVIDGEPVSPRLLNRGLPRDLATISLKCLERDPRKRYPTAAALAHDLERFLGDEPIQARPTGRLQRLGRWCRRRPLIAGLIAAIVLVLLTGTAVSCYFTVEASRRAQDATERLWQAYLAQARAGRRSGRDGQRFDSLKAIASAGAIRPSPELRDEAIACMALADLRLARRWTWLHPGDPHVQFDAALEHCAGDDGEGNIVIRAADDGQILARLSSPGPADGLPVFSPDGRYVARKYYTSGRAECLVWDWRDSRVAFGVPVISADWPIEFSPDGGWLATVSPEGYVQLHTVPQGSLALSRAVRRAPAGIRFHPLGRQVALFRPDDPLVEVLDLASGEIGQVLPYRTGILDCCWSAQGDLFAVGGMDFRVAVYLGSGFSQQLVARGHQGEVAGVAFNPGGSILVSRSWDGTTRLWEPKGMRQILRTEGEFRQISRDGKRLGFWDFDTVGIWDVVEPECRMMLRGSEPGKGPWNVDFSPDGRWLAAASDDGVRLWDLAHGRQRVFLALGVTRSAIFAPGGEALVTSGASGLQYWPIVKGYDSDAIELGSPTSLNGPARNYSDRACFSLSGQLLAAVTAPAQATLFNVENPAKTVVCGEHPGVAFVAISPDENWLATGTFRGAGGVRVWNARNGAPVKGLLPDSEMTRVLFSPNGNWLVASTHRAYHFIQVGTWQETHRIPRERPGFFGPLAFSPDSRTVAVAVSRYVVALFDPATSQRLATLESPDPVHLSWLSFSPDGTHLAAASENQTIQIWDLRAIRRQLRELRLDWDRPP